MELFYEIFYFPTIIHTIFYQLIVLYSPLLGSFYADPSLLPYAIKGGDGTASEGSMDYDDRTGDESDEDGRSSHSPDTDYSIIVNPSNFDSHMAAQTTHSNIPVQRLVQSVKQVFLEEEYIENKLITSCVQDIKP
jgi:hypothetical protein